MGTERLFIAISFIATANQFGYLDNYNIICSIMYERFCNNIIISELYANYKRLRNRFSAPGKPMYTGVCSNYSLSTEIRNNAPV